VPQLPVPTTHGISTGGTGGGVEGTASLQNFLGLLDVRGVRGDVGLPGLKGPRGRSFLEGIQRRSKQVSQGGNEHIPELVRSRCLLCVARRKATV
jgi:hypothetical protein